MVHVGEGPSEVGWVGVSSQSTTVGGGGTEFGILKGQKSCWGFFSVNSLFKIYHEDQNYNVKF